MTNTNQVATAGDISRDAAAELIYREAMLLDERQWEEWLSLYTTDAVFWMPSWGSESELITDPELELNLIYFKNRDGLEDRVFRIESGDSFATVPMDRTAHVVGSVLVTGREPGQISARASWNATVMDRSPSARVGGTSTANAGRSVRPSRSRAACATASWSCRSSGRIMGEGW